MNNSPRTAALEALQSIKSRDEAASQDEQNVLYRGALAAVDVIGSISTLEEAIELFYFVSEIHSQLMRALVHGDAIEIDREFLRDFDRIDDSGERQRVFNDIVAGKRYK